MSNPKSSLMKPPAFKKKVERTREQKAEEEEELNIIDTVFVPETKAIVAKNPIEDILRQELAMIKSRLVVLEQQSMQLPTLSKALEWCKKHPEHMSAKKVLHFGHSWSGPIRAYEDILRDMLKEGNS